MTRIEGENTRVRHYLARLKRKSLCYSKSDNENKNQGVTKDYKNNMVFIFKLSVICRIYRYRKTRDDVEIERSLYLNYPSVQDLSVDEDLSISHQLCDHIIFYFLSRGLYRSIPDITD